MGPTLRAGRSTEAPMDFQFTSRPSSNVRPVWATSEEDMGTPRKRPHDDLNSSTPSFPSPVNNLTFGTNKNVPFIFQTPTRQTSPADPWSPPPSFSPSKAFPQPCFQEELIDVEMTETSPPKTEEKDERPMALGALRRVFKSRRKARNGRNSVLQSQEAGRDDESGSESEGDDSGKVTPVAQNTSNHYTLNIPSPVPHQSDLPYILLGYLQFFFNLSLVLVFLYLVVQFILTVQRDVELRVSEYSMEIVQEITMCALQYKNNLCASNPIPAMTQQCSHWETCMNRDPTIVGRAKVGAELIAEVVNGFVEPISWKTLAFTLTSLSFLTVFINTLLSLYRSRHHPTPSAPPPIHQPTYPIAPVTPFPANHFGGYLSPAPTPSWGRSWSQIGCDSDNLQTPTRRRRIEGGGVVKVK